MTTTNWIFKIKLRDTDVKFGTLAVGKCFMLPEQVPHGPVFIKTNEASIRRLDDFSWANVRIPGDRMVREVILIRHEEKSNGLENL